MKTVNALGIDLAKNVFQIHAVNRAEKRLWSKKVTRSQLVRQITQIDPCRIFMEACGSAHYWAREFSKYGHEVKLIAGQHVKKFVSGNKSDAIDAEAIVVCGLRPSTRFVPIKNQTQLRQQALHRIRQRLVKERTAVCNEMRAILYEEGIVISVGRKKLASKVKELLHSGELDQGLATIVADLYRQYLDRQELIEHYESQIDSAFSGDAKRQKIEKVPGVGSLTATAILTEIGNGEEFFNGRHLAAFFGLVPRHTGTGGRNANHSMSKRGDCYIRTLLIHGARSVLRHTANRGDPLSKWAENLKQRVGHNRAAVALANKNARIIWKLLTSDLEFDSRLAA